MFSKAIGLEYLIEADMNNLITKTQIKAKLMLIIMMISFGLSICKRLINKMGGDISVESV